MRLDAYSKASRLSYALWNAGPDAELLAAAGIASRLDPKRGFDHGVFVPMLLPAVKLVDVVSDTVPYQPIAVDLVLEVAFVGAVDEAQRGKLVEHGVVMLGRDRDLEPVQHVWQLKRSGDGTLRSTNPLYVHAGDTIRAGWNCDIPSVLPPGTVISTEDEPELVNDTGEIGLTAIGHDAKIAKVELAVDDTAEAGSHWVKVLVTNTNGGGPIAVYGEVVIQAEPE